MLFGALRSNMPDVSFENGERAEAEMSDRRVGEGIVSLQSTALTVG